MTEAFRDRGGHTPASVPGGEKSRLVAATKAIQDCLLDVERSYTPEEMAAAVLASVDRAAMQAEFEHYRSQQAALPWRRSLVQVLIALAAVAIVVVMFVLLIAEA